MRRVRNRLAGPRAVPLLTLLATAAFVPISEIARIGKEFSDTMASARRLFAVEDEPVPVRDGKEGGKGLSGTECDIGAR